MFPALIARRPFARRSRLPLADPVMHEMGKMEFLEREFEESAKEVALREIDRLDLSPMKKKLCLPVAERGKGWSQSRAEEAEKWYKRFLKLCVLQDEKVVPPGDVDEMWHTHILFTRKYHEACRRIFGHYLHHSPSDGTEEGKHDMEASFLTTLSRFDDFFGERPLEGKDSSRADCHCNGHCCGNDK